MAWWKILLLFFAGNIAAVGVYIAVIFIYAAIKEHRMERKYPDWKHRGGRRS